MHLKLGSSVAKLTDKEILARFNVRRPPEHVRRMGDAIDLRAGHRARSRTPRGDPRA